MMTHGGVEIDLVVDRPGEKFLFVEIKNKEQILGDDLYNINRMATEFVDCEAVCISCDKRAKKIDQTTVYPWQQGIEQFFWSLIEKVFPCPRL